MQRVIERRKTVVAGPLNLVQGGIGIIGRTPIFIRTDDLDEDQYFGILSVVINIPSLFEEAGLSAKDALLKIAIKGKDGLGSEGDVFYGNEDLFANRPVLMEVALPGGSWQMASVPSNGWGSDSPRIPYYRLVALIVGLVVMALLFVQQHEMNQRKNAEREKEKLIAELQEALTEVNQLSGLLPICSSCKKIRDDKGYWNQIETYISDHSDAKFSHSICVECAKKYYPDLDIFDD